MGRGNFPTLEVRLRDLVDIVRAKLEGDPTAGGAGMRVRDIRLNGGAASHVLAAGKSSHHLATRGDDLPDVAVVGQEQPYNDVDLIFGVELSSPRNFDKVKAAVLSSLYDMLPDGVSRKRISTCSLKEAYVSKMVKVSFAFKWETYYVASYEKSDFMQQISFADLQTFRVKFYFMLLVTYRNCN